METITSQAAGFSTKDHRLLKNIEIFPSRHELARIHFDFFGKECSRSAFASGPFLKGFSFVVAVGSLYHRITIRDIFIYVMQMVDLV